MAANKHKHAEADDFQEEFEQEDWIAAGETAQVAAEGEDSDNATDPEATGQTLESQLEAARQEARDNYDRVLRVTAEFENYKKRAQREMQDFRKYANESLIKALLPVVDNLERAICSAREVDDQKTDQACVVDGVEMIRKELLRVLEGFNVIPIDALGQPFDPSYHQAVMQEKVTDPPDNTVLQEFQKGYLMHERLLRPSMVVVSKMDNGQG